MLFRSGECFPTRYRSTGHGLSAAMGKVGAILAQVISIPLLSSKCHAIPGEEDQCRHPWLDRLMQIFALFMLLGTLTSLLVPETKGITLEELAGEDVEGEEGGGGEGGAGEAEDEEEEGEDGEAEDLDGFAAQGVDGEDGGPVAGEGACAGEDDHADGVVVEGVVEGWAVGVGDCGEDYCVV